MPTELANHGTSLETKIFSPKGLCYNYIKLVMERFSRRYLFIPLKVTVRSEFKSAKKNKSTFINQQVLLAILRIFLIITD